MHYIYHFEKHGQTRYASDALPNEIWLDVGNTLAPGFFDHHQTAEYKSAFDALLGNKAYLMPLLRSAKTAPEIHIHMHTAPDLDCLACLFAVRSFLEAGEEAPGFLCGSETLEKTFLKYVNRIDSGLGKHIDRPTLYALISTLSEVRFRGDDTAQAEAGIRLLSLAAAILESNPAFSLEMDAMTVNAQIRAEFAQEIAAIGRDTFRDDIAQKRVSLENVQIWDKNGNTHSVSAAIWTELPANGNNYIYARERGCVVTILPETIRGVNGSEETRCILAINPELDPQQNYTLKPFAEVFEQLEQLQEQQIFAQTHTLRRNYGISRESTGVLSELPFRTTSDPWFLSPEEDLVAAPRSGSLLEYRDLVAMLRGNAGAVRQAFCLDAESGVKNFCTGTTLSQWMLSMRERLAASGSFQLIFAQLDASLIHHTNRLLEILCLNTVSKSTLDDTSAHFMHPDYNTCIYADETACIILTAVQNDAAFALLPAAARLDKQLPETVRTVLHQRKMLQNFGMTIGSQPKMPHKKAEALYAEILTFLVQMQKEDMISDPFCREVYAFLKRVLQIDACKAAILEETGLLVSESRNALVSRFNLLSAFAVPFILTATAFQMGLIRMQPLLSLSEALSPIGWGCTAALLGGATWYIASGKHKKDKEN